MLCASSSLDVHLLKINVYYCKYKLFFSQQLPVKRELACTAEISSHTYVSLNTLYYK